MDVADDRAPNPIRRCRCDGQVELLAAVENSAAMLGVEQLSHPPDNR
jgi:hypothetical protein